MSGFAKNGVLYPTGIYAIDDNAVSPNTGWSSKKVMDKLASVKSIMRVDAKPTITDGTITYVKDGTSYTTTDQEAWFYYVADDELYKTIFIDGIEYTKADSGVNFDDFIEKSAIVTTLLNDTVTNEQVVSAKIVHELTKGKNLKTYTDYPDVGIDKTNFTLEEVATKLNNASALMVGTDNKTPNIFPKIFGHFIALKKSDDKVKFFFFPNENGEDSSIYFCGYHPRIGVTEWQKVCTTSVPDVSDVPINFISGTPLEGTGATYSVKDGWCTIRFSGGRPITELSNAIEQLVVAENIPKPIKRVWHTGQLWGSSDSAYLLSVNNEGKLFAWLNTSCSGCYTYMSITYPVAEDWRP